MTRHRLLSEQLREIEAAREQAALAAEPDCAVQQIQMLARLVGLGLATASGLTREVFCRSFADRRAIAGFVGLTGTPFNSGGSEREQGISKAGNPRVRRILLQLAWRWLRFQPDSALSCWSSSAPEAPKDASARSWWWRSPASCWWRCGATSRPAKCRPARASPPPER
jgi:transposase